MKFLAKFYYLPFLIGIIFSILFWISSIDAKLRVEGYAKINTTHSLTNRDSEIFWETVHRQLLKKYDNQSVWKKRHLLRFRSKNNDIEEIKKNYQDVKNEYKKYKEIYLSQQQFDLREYFNTRNLTNKMKNKLKDGQEYLSMLSEREFLLELKINEVIIRHNQFIYITLLVSFFLSIILYNIKKVFFK